MTYHEHHHFEFNKILHDRMSKIYIFQALHTFAKSFIGVFVPVYLYKVGFPFTDIVLYSVLCSVAYLILIPLVVKVIRQIGFKYTLVVSIPFYLMQIFFLNFVGVSKVYFYLACVTYSIYLSFFWPVFHSEIALNGSDRHRSSQLGTLQVITTIFGTIAPIIGGFILSAYSYFHLFVFASVIILIGLIPLLISHDIRLKHYDFHYKDYFNMFKSRKNLSSKKAFRFEGFNSLLILTLWPIIIFIFLDRNFFNFGALVTFVSFISVMVILYIKSYFDRRNKEKLVSRVSKAVSTNWFLKSLVVIFGTGFLLVIEVIAKFVWQIFSIVYMSIFYNNANKVGYMDYIILRELYLHTSKLFFGLVLIFVFTVFGETMLVLNSIVLSGTIVSLGLGLMREEIK